MFLDADIKGADLPPRVLSLTYDDGPGPRTAELSQYLRAEGIAATFFVIGGHAELWSKTLAQLHRDGHLIGNHTYSHLGLVALVEADGDGVGELARTDKIIRNFADGGPIFFRAPYGSWRQVDPASGTDHRQSIVAQQLNRCVLLRDYIGPVNWDISAEDFAFWRRGASAGEAAQAYLHEIETTGRGIVLLHDSSEDPAIARQNRTLELMTLLVPELRRRGYRFVPLGKLPAVKRILATRRIGAGICRSR